MKPRFSLLAVLMLTVTLALVGVLRDVNTGKALIPDPVQPFLADASGGMADTTLGNPVAVNNYTMTVIPRGSRTTLPWIYSGPGWDLDVDKEMTDGDPLGSVFSYVDALCDSVNTGDSDILEQLPCSGPGDIHPLIWNETTTAIEGTSSEFLKSLVPPYSFLARHTANITNICLYGTTEKGTTSVLNTMYTNVPFSANGSAFTATTKLGGDPAIPPNSTCLDSPQSSTSITDIYHAPALEGDSDGPCDTGTYACADAAIYGMWTDNVVTGSKTVTVKKVLLNNGPETGNFSEHFEIELTNPGVMTAVWSQTGTAIIDEPVALAKSVSTEVSKSLAITCTGTGEGLVVLKNVLWPVAPTKDTYADDNAFVFVVKVICGAAGSPLVDKEVIWIKPVAVGNLDPASPDLDSKPDHLQLDLGQAITVTIDELKANHATVPVLGHEWLVAEVANIANLGVEWDTGSVTIDQGGTPLPVAPVTACTTGDACIQYEVLEPQGQSDVKADLTITCGAVPGLYSVVLKAIDAPVAPLGELKPSDNAQRSVIKVWCGLAAMDPDGIEDANGLYARWTVFQSVGISSLQIAGENRLSYKSPPSIASDIGYVERIVDLQCFWMDNDGCFEDAGNTNPCNDDGNAYIDEVESWDDYDLLALGGIDALDEDGDCLMNAALAQPSHPVDELDHPTVGANCGAVPYSEAPNIVVHSVASDQDCDGLVDGIEKAWGSNDQLADSDGDFATDFVEIFQQTNPLNPDTDGDGVSDKPEDDYAAVAAGSNEAGETVTDDNCPGVANADQANNDGQRIDNGAIPNP